jgi:hypothetical protein
MTFCAKHIYMLAIKPESRLIMIKPGSFPGVSTMTPGAICYAVFFKLPVMIIIVAI